jgi:hypothetical protein
MSTRPNESVNRIWQAVEMRQSSGADAVLCEMAVIKDKNDDLGSSRAAYSDCSGTE